jgi:hypothetical protein
LALALLAAWANEPVVLEVEDVDALVPCLDTRCARSVSFAAVAQVVLAVYRQFHVGIRQHLWGHSDSLSLSLISNCGSFGVLAGVLSSVSLRTVETGDHSGGRSVSLDSCDMINGIGGHHDGFSRGARTSNRRGGSEMR